MRREGIVSVILGLIGLALFTWLKVSQGMGDSAYVLLFAVLSFVCLVVNGFSRLSELDLKNLRLTLTKIEEARADVYAKQRDVIRISMQLARMIAFLGAFQSRRMSAETLDIVKRWYRTQTCKLIDSLEPNYTTPIIGCRVVFRCVFVVYWRCVVVYNRVLFGRGFARGVHVF